MDLDGDGAIQVNMRRAPATGHQLLLNRLLLQLDEFRFFCDNCSSNPEVVFASIDADGDGNLTKGELCEALRIRPALADMLYLDMNARIASAVPICG